MLDAIFKEDIEAYNKTVILKFIAKNKPDDTQIILSIAEKSDHEKVVNGYNATYFNNQGKVILIGGGVNVKSFLTDYKGQEDRYLKETLGYILNN